MRDGGGEWVRLESFPACEVWVRDSEVEVAIRQSGKNRNPSTVAHNIALGIRCGSYDLVAPPERRHRFRALRPEAERLVHEMRDARDDNRALEMDAR